MATFFPTLNEITQLKVKPTEGELHLLHTLKNEFVEDDSIEIYFQPLLNSDRPDLFIMKKNAGILIIEVKDYNPQHYCINEKKQWCLKKSKSVILSPIEQVNRYKKNTIRFHAPELYRRELIEHQNNFGVIQCLVYFHHYTEKDLEKVKENLGIRDTNHLTLFSKDNLKIKLHNLLKRSYFYTGYTSSYFTPEIYEPLKDMLRPSYHELRIGKQLNYSKKQLQLSKSSPSKNLNIHGFAGTGKTAVLAKRAVNGLKRTGGPILILTFNITLRQYIKDQISNVRENFNWEYFEFNHYHQFITTNALNYEVDFDYDFENEHLFEDVKNKIIKYPVILLDEVQDYDDSWLKIIKKYFLAENGEFVCFKDGNQTIYRDSHNHETKDLTKWVSLNEEYRSPNALGHLLIDFQAQYLKKYTELNPIQLSLNLKEASFSYYYLESTKELLTKQLTDTIFQSFRSKGFPNQNDVAFLGTNKQVLRELQEHLISQGKLEEQFITTFASIKEVAAIEAKVSQYDTVPVEDLIKSFERSKKFAFHMNSGKIKMSTIHSYKGWEIKNLVLIINKPQKNQSETFNNLVYTGLSRCVTNLIVLNIGNSDYHSFFEDQNTAFSQAIDYRSLDTLERRTLFYREHDLSAPEEAQDYNMTLKEFHAMKEMQHTYTQERNQLNDLSSESENGSSPSSLASDLGMTNKEYEEELRLQHEESDREYSQVNAAYRNYLKNL
ncbi:AAA family ATPase [Carnobacterium sp. TMP28]|uniref:nuclease-related domain-containing DEAD/DEAH box helicase n=1 Tax=Carnobacterium sp. TMP28 TaxID=3397060 RepID=UPI0039DFBB42